MPVPSPCPTAEALQRFLLGLTPLPEVGPIGDHLALCDRCAEAVQSVRAHDPLIEAMRAGAAMPDPSDPEIIDGLVVRLEALEPTAAGAVAAGRPAAPEDTPPPGRETFDFLSPAQEPGEIGRLGPYRVLDVLGAGGMGVVFRADDPQLGRTVALKALKPDRAQSKSDRVRFLREARAAAALQHNHIVAVHQVGEENGVPFLAMQLLHGETLEARLRREEKIAPAEAARIGREVAEGLAAAHAHGLMHRDIKPDNIWLEVDGGRVKLLDFGLARGVDDEVRLTQTGVIAGTPAYMAPEQARGRPEFRSDLFSLGCVLYRMCTGVPPFRGADALAVLAALASDRPRAPHALDPAVPRPLSELVMRLLAKRPEDRFASAQAVAAALTTLDLRPRQAGRFWKRAALAAGAAVVLLIVGAFGWRALFPPPTAGGRDAEPRPPAVADDSWHDDLDALAARVEANGSADPTDEGVATLRRAFVAYRARHPGTAEALRASAVMARLPWPADALRADRIPVDEWAAVRDGDTRPAPAGLVAVLGDSRFKHWSRVQSVAFSPDGKTVATVCADGAARLWDAATGRLKRTLLPPSGRAVLAAAFHPDGAALAGVIDGGRVTVWDVNTGEMLHSWQGPSNYALCLAYSKGGGTLALGNTDGTATLHDPETGEVRKTMTVEPPNGHVVAVAFSPQDDALAAAGPTVLGLWDLDSGQRRRRFPGHTGLVNGVAFSPDGKRLASCSDDRTVKLWRTDADEEPLTLKGESDKVYAVAFSPDGGAVASTGEDGAVRLWRADDGTERGALKEHAGPVRSLAFRADGTLASAGDDGTVRLWDAAEGRELPLTAESTRPLHCLDFSPDGATLAAAGAGGAITLWDAASGEVRGRLAGHRGAVRSVAYSPDGRALASAGDDGILRRWDAATGEEAPRGESEGFGIHGLAWSRDGKTLASGNDGSIDVTLWDAATGEVLRHLSGHKWAVHSLGFSPDGGTLASGSDHVPVKLIVKFSQSPPDAVNLWDMRRLRSRATFTESVWGDHAVAFSPDGATLASGGRNGGVRFWDAATGTEAPNAATGHFWKVTSVAFSPDGATLASSAADGTVRLWDPHTGQNLSEIRLCRPAGTVSQVVFSPEGRHLAAANANGTVYILRLPPPP